MTDNLPDLKKPAAPAQRTVEELFNDARVRDRLAKVAGRTLNPDRLMRVVAFAAKQNPLLAEADAMSLLGATMFFAMLGLEPNTPLGHGYLIPFRENKWNRETKQREFVRVNVTPIIGYRGFVELLGRSPAYVALHGDYATTAEYEQGLFSFEFGTNQHLKHRYSIHRDDTDQNGARVEPPMWAYSHVRLKDGESFGVMPWAKVLSRRDMSQGYRQASGYHDEWKQKGARGLPPPAWRDHPWVKFETEMGVKTVIRQHAKTLRLTVEAALAAAADEAGEGGTIDLTAMVNANTVDQAREVAETAVRDAQDPPQIEGPDAERDQPVDQTRDRPKQEQATTPEPERTKRTYTRRTLAPAAEAAPPPPPPPAPEPPPQEEPPPVADDRGDLLDIPPDLRRPPSAVTARRAPPPPPAPADDADPFAEGQ